jgi:hypothetical protein
MTKHELINRLASDHNLISSMEVSKENIILAGDVMRDLRSLVQRLGSEPVEEEENDTEGA